MSQTYLLWERATHPGRGAKIEIVGAGLPNVVDFTFHELLLFVELLHSLLFNELFLLLAATILAYGKRAIVSGMVRRVGSPEPYILCHTFSLSV